MTTSSLVGNTFFFDTSPLGTQLMFCVVACRRLFSGVQCVGIAIRRSSTTDGIRASRVSRVPLPEDAI